MSKIKANRYHIAVILIVLVSFILRFYRLWDRWGIGSDDARDITIAMESIRRRQLPLFGSFSSAGPFVFGPLFYWFIIISYLVFPFGIPTPWIILSLIGVINVYLLILIGKMLGGNKLSLITGVLAATSPQLILRSSFLSQHSLVLISTIFLIYFFIQFWQKGKLINTFFMGISLGTGLSMHYQILNLFIFLPFILFGASLTIRKKILGVICFITGLIIPSLPLLIWDSHQQWANLRNIADYLLIGQYRIYVPNSWKLFLSQFFPDYWSFVTGGQPVFGFGIMISFLAFFLYNLIKKRLSNPAFILMVIFILLLTVNRYYRGERFEGYMLYLTPFIIIFSAWTLNIFIKGKKIIISSLLISLITIASLFRIKNDLLYYHNNYKEAEKTANLLIDKYKGKKISLYDYHWLNSGLSYPLTVALNQRKLSGKNGIPLGVTCKDCPINYPVVTTILDLPIVELESDQALIKKEDWNPVTGEDIYDGLITRWTYNKLQSSFHFIKQHPE
ncbi:hypothetical protein A2960_00260 [Candidatus Gottesmanbacteria bacterium RIFCSPLOWO2_01_FULL_39_12b]|uniref:Glycosyltransferase RgtA/B/C/D-like domain-containing protein n=1 Tax=Candidatus Gottesmanbacteria bacterium RIFCSPLOWO2_01_FULL_39_12b TaxID=1798388 RepID=A0A1F6ARC0_9BACT|nr:MAG: hypothetical protein A2960_00260 [Candidatus Gottesmanbacteria bacterium RIFCSPLOWO2_01_FULL_39_12b]